MIFTCYTASTTVDWVELDKKALRTYGDTEYFKHMSWSSGAKNIYPQRSSYVGRTNSQHKEWCKSFMRSGNGTLLTKSVIHSYSMRGIRRLNPDMTSEIIDAVISPIGQSGQRLGMSIGFRNRNTIFTSPLSRILLQISSAL